MTTKDASRTVTVLNTKKKTVVQQTNPTPLGLPGYIDIGKAMAEATSPHRPSPTPVPKGAQKVPPDGMIMTKRQPLTQKVQFPHGIPVKQRPQWLKKKT